MSESHFNFLNIYSHTFDFQIRKDFEETIHLCETLAAEKVNIV